MKKVITLILLLLSQATYAQTCPPSNMVFIKSDNGRYYPSAPQGWQISTSVPSHISSPDVHFVLAAFGPTPPQQPKPKDNHIRCYYGNPEISFYQGIAIKMINEMPESAVSKHANWVKEEPHYFRCKQPDNINACSFG